GVLSCLKPRNLCPGLLFTLCISAGTNRRWAALMRINIWIVLIVLMALLAVTRLLRYQQVRNASAPMTRAPRSAGGELPLHASVPRPALPDLCLRIVLQRLENHLAL